MLVVIFLLLCGVGDRSFLTAGISGVDIGVGVSDGVIRRIMAEQAGSSAAAVLAVAVAMLAMALAVVNFDPAHLLLLEIAGCCHLVITFNLSDNKCLLDSLTYKCYHRR